MEGDRNTFVPLCKRGENSDYAAAAEELAELYARVKVGDKLIKTLHNEGTPDYRYVIHLIKERAGILVLIEEGEWVNTSEFRTRNDKNVEVLLHIPKEANAFQREVGKFQTWETADEIRGVSISHEPNGARALTDAEKAKVVELLEAQANERFDEVEGLRAQAQERLDFAASFRGKTCDVAEANASDSASQSSAVGSTSCDSEVN